MRASAFALSVAFLLLGCARDSDIQTYRISKETPIPSPLASKTLHSGPLDWKKPTHWIEQAPSSMRFASFLAPTGGGKSADISVIPLGGSAGGDIANINRWRSQIGLEPLSATDLPSNSQTMTFADHSMLWVDFENKGQRLTAAIFKRGDRTWFFKMTGDDAVVKSTQPSFREFLRSLHFHDTP